MYDAFSSDYDRFVNWPGRLAFELSFITKQLQTLTTPVGRPLRLLDAACGTGMHVIALAQQGYKVAGADLSAPMIERAQTNAATAGVGVLWAAIGFGKLSRTFGKTALFPFDGLFCLGNSLPHLLTEKDLVLTLADFCACLHPGGMLLLQNRNFDAVMPTHERWMEPQSHHEGTSERIFLRFYDYDPDGLLSFNILTLKRESGGDWHQQVTTTRLRPLLQAELIEALSAVGFDEIACFGGLIGSLFDPKTSGNLVVVARLRGK
ncbi:MAG: class I SAM-dependent methyltransferase [Kiritimatiellota bacterium]|nr:class I SAM-dependent methyltransferase [Kiritimatiellota bacterium]